jgi:hypothetical protein
LPKYSHHKKANKSINLTGNSRALKRWAVSRPAGYFTVGLQSEENMQTGDWVRSYYRGIWQIYRIVHGFYEFRFSLQEEKVLSNRTLVFSKRIVNDRWKRSFSAASCEASLVEPLSDKERAGLDMFIGDNPKVIKAFEKYKPKSVDFLMNLSFGCPRGLSAPDVRQQLAQLLTPLLTKGANLDELLVALEESGLNRYRGLFPRNLTLQFKSHDYELQGKDFLFRSLNVLPF